MQCSSQQAALIGFSIPAWEMPGWDCWENPLHGKGNVDGSVSLAEKAKIILENRKENVGVRVLRSEKGSPKASRFTASPSSGDVRRQQGWSQSSKSWYWGKKKYRYL